MSTFMNRHTKIILLFIVASILFAPPAFAWKSVRVGQKNFERAWERYTMLEPDKANEFFKKSADAFAEALAADPPSKTARFISTLTMAGMSFYFADRYEESIDAMELVQRKEKKIWETNIFIGLAKARLGDETKAVEFLNLYLQSMPSQRVLSNAVTQQLEQLGTKSVTLIDATANIDKALQLQFIENINWNNSRSTNPANERCSGSLWWRKNRAPCSEAGYGLNSM